MVPTQTTFHALPASDITHRIVHPGVNCHVKCFVDDGLVGAFTAIGMTPDEAHLEALVSLAENGIKSEIMISSCGGDEVMSAYSNCVFYMVSHVVFRDSRMVQV